MKKTTLSLALVLILGAFTQASANESIQTQLSAIKSAAPAERQSMIQELQTQMQAMRVQERTRTLQEVREQMPDLADKIQNDYIAQRIDEIKNTDPMQRRELMNSFKQELAQMNEQERTEALTQMRKEMLPADKTQIRDQDQVRDQKRLQDGSQKEQLQQMEQMQQRDQMNQRQGAEQLRQQQIQGTMQPDTNGFGQRK
jgi:hypothetical protein